MPSCRYNETILIFNLFKFDDFLFILLVILNDNSIYFVNEKRSEISYRGQIVGIYLNELVTSFDEIFDKNNKKCCQRISKVWFNPITTNFCIKLESNTSFWNLCKESWYEVEEFRIQLLNFVLKRPDNLLFLDEVPVRPPIINDGTVDWNWIDQHLWIGQCLNGYNQSPVLLQDVQIQEENKYQLDWDFSPNKEVLPKVYYDGHEFIVNGDFGTFEFKNQCNSINDKFRAKQLTLKQNSEHFRGNSRLAELQVTCENLKDKSIAILSFLLKEESLAQPNEFFNQLNTFSWQSEKDFKSEFTSLLDLNTLVPGGAKQYYNKSFYFYWGSESRPPCQEYVRRIVFEHPIEITEFQLDEIKKSASFKGSSSNTGNFRQPQNLGNRVVFHSKDTQTKCAGYQNWPYDVQQQVQSIKSKEALNNEKKDAELVTKYKVIQLSKQNYYSYMRKL